MALSFQRQGIFGRRNPMDMPQAMPQETPQAMPIGVGQITKKPGFFGQGGAGRAIAGTIGDFLLQQSGMDPVYLPNILQQRDAEERARMAEQQRVQAREDKQWEWQNKPKDEPNPTEFERILAASGLPQDQQIQLMQDYARNRANPVQGVPYTDAQGNSGIQFIRPGQMQGGGAPQAPVGKLTPIGGQSGVPTGSFRSPPSRLKSGFMTSGRRTPEGNKLVGGHPNSGHLRGTDVDYDGADLNAVLREVQGLPGYQKAFIHDGHVHARGEWDVPYFGKNGTKGLKR